MSHSKREMSLVACLELQTLQTREGRHIRDDREAPEKPAATSDYWYVTTISGLTVLMRMQCFLYV